MGRRNLLAPIGTIFKDIELTIKTPEPFSGKQSSTIVKLVQLIFSYAVVTLCIKCSCGLTLQTINGNLQC